MLTTHVATRPRRLICHLTKVETLKKAIRWNRFLSTHGKKKTILCESAHLQILTDEALFERSRIRVLDGEVPTTKDLKAHVYAVAIPKHPGVLVADYRPVRGVCR